MTVETISTNNLRPLAQLFLALWPECSFDEEYENCTAILNNENETCYLIKEQEDYIAFIHVTIRFDYVEGADASPVVYLEAIFVKENYRQLGLGEKLVQLGADWGKQKGCNQMASDTGLDNVAAIGFHGKTGFLEVNRIVCFLKEI